MELWVRSQNKSKLIKVNSVYLPSPINADTFFPKIIANDGDYLGSYETTKRALEVLDEIQSKIKQQFLCKPNPTLSCKNIERAEDILNLKYKQKFIMEPPGIDIEPINISAIIYEMPEE